MSKFQILVIIASALLFGSACHEIDYTKVEHLKFEKDVVGLDSKQQEVEIKANFSDWLMAVEDENGNRIEGDTINGEWYALIKKDKGASLLIKVTSNSGKERSLVVGFRCLTSHTRMLLKQQGIE